ncbi:MAG: hypothetical protein AAF654_05300 [Myxococcota bacterium]
MFCFAFIELFFVLLAAQGLRSIQVRSGAAVVLTTLDFSAASYALGWLMLLALASVALAPPLLILLAVLAPMIVSFRIRVEVDGDQASVKRCALWRWAWKRTPLREPYAWVDGWGDWLDPEALWIGERSDAWDRSDASFEIGWGTCYSADMADRQADAFNAAVAEITSKATGTSSAADS